MLRSTVLFIILAFLALSAPPRADAQVVPPGGRPLIGLVLGGGGAKGGAHIGVLKVLEDLRVPVDMIAGTSVGAIIGGMYAFGLTPEDLDRIVREMNWHDLIAGGPPRGGLTFRRKQDDSKFPTRLELGFNSGSFRLPSGLVTGQNLEVVFRSVSLPGTHVTSFEELPIPFRAVATDIVTGEMVVLKGGDLSTAVRASMSIPGAFSPVDVDGRLLVDGAVVRNLPVDVMREMGADVIIAVDLTPPLYTRDQLESAVEVSSQVLRITSAESTSAQIRLLEEMGGVLIRPDVDSVRTSAFAGLPATIAEGEAAARELADRLSRYSVSREEYEEYRARRTSGTSGPLRVDFVRVEGATRLAPEVVEARLRIRAGQIIEPKDLERAMARVYGLDVFERVDYRVVHEEGRVGLIVEVIEKSWGPGFFRVGLALGDDLERPSSSFTLLLSHTQTQINRLGGEFRAELQIGEAQAFSVEFYQPVDVGGRFFVAPRFEFIEEPLGIVQRGAGESTRGVEQAGAMLAAGVQFLDWGEARVELGRGWVNATEAGAEGADIGGLRSSLSVDMLDDRGFPTRGVTARVELYNGLRALGSDPAYSRLVGGATGVISRGPDTFILAGKAGTSFGRPLPRQDDFSLGGFLELSGLRPRTVIGNYLAFARVTYRRRIATVPTTVAGGGLFVGFTGEVGNVWELRRDVDVGDLRASAGVFAGVETLLGPLYLSYARADQGEDAWHLFLGQAF
ncbi:MAG: patatin-like phospholipase PlpD [Gemmatimonadota bacterium]|nr:MAG: patatin-like phospholipase PlpD [Gemmatimonadota bacterium]